MRKLTLRLTAAALASLVFSGAGAMAAGDAWEAFMPFPVSASGRVEAVAIFDQGTLYVLGGQPYRCPGPLPCEEPELGAADFLPAGGPAWLEGEPFDDRLGRLGGGRVSPGGPVGFGGARADDLEGGDQTFYYDPVLGDQTEPTLGRRTFLHTNFAWTSDNLGRIYSIGGGPGLAATAGNPNAADVERFDIGSNSWIVLAAMPEARANAAAAYDGQGHILVFGGYDALATERRTDVLSYDIATDTWGVLGALPLPAAGGNDFSDQRAQLGANGSIYIVGGQNGPVGSGVTRSQVYTYEPVTDTWGTAPELGTPRHGVALALNEDGWLYALGGFNGSVGLSSNERFDTNAAGTDCVTASDCSDGLDCNGDEFCVDGGCLPGIPVECQAGEFCAAGGICRIQRFDIIDLGALLSGFGASGGSANGINDAGVVVGDYYDTTAGEWHGFRYDGSMQVLGAGRAMAISDDGWIAGDDGVAFVIDPNTGERTLLGTLGGAGSAAMGVANGGWTVGQSDMPVGDDHAFLVRGPGAPMEDLGTLGSYSIAHGIDPTGLVVGESLVQSFDPHADPFAFDSSMPGAVITPMPGAYASGSSRAINELGHATGWIAYNVDHWGHAFVNDGVEMTDLGDIPGKAYSIGTAINNLDQVVGYAFGEWVYQPCCGNIWSNGIHTAYFHDGLTGIRLDDELPESSGWVLTRATGINDAGAIIGIGHHDGQGRPFLMVPHTADQDGDGLPDSLDNCPVAGNAEQLNSDADSHGDACDNCTLDDNEDQRDTNADGFGNLCDTDLDDSGTTNFGDLAIFKSVFLTNDPDADFDGDGTVSFGDLARMKERFLQPPGP